MRSGTVVAAAVKNKTKQKKHSLPNLKESEVNTVKTCKVGVNNLEDSTKPSGRTLPMSTGQWSSRWGGGENLTAAESLQKDARSKR